MCGNGGVGGGWGKVAYIKHLTQLMDVPPWTGSVVFAVRQEVVTVGHLSHPGRGPTAPGWTDAPLFIRHTSPCRCTNCTLYTSRPIRAAAVECEICGAADCESLISGHYHYRVTARCCLLRLFVTSLFQVAEPTPFRHLVVPTVYRYIAIIDISIQLFFLFSFV